MELLTGSDYSHQSPSWKMLERGGEIFPVRQWKQLCPRRHGQSLANNGFVQCDGGKAPLHNNVFDEPVSCFVLQRQTPASATLLEHKEPSGRKRNVHHELFCTAWGFFVLVIEFAAGPVDCITVDISFRQEHHWVAVTFTLPTTKISCAEMAQTSAHAACLTQTPRICSAN